MAANDSNAKRPAQKKSAGSDSFLGWLGRQVGHVKKAVATDVTRPAKAKSDTPPQAKKPSADPKVIYRQDKVEEADMPDRPGVKLRRTIIDEVIVVKKED